MDSRDSVRPVVNWAVPDLDRLDATRLLERVAIGDARALEQLYDRFASDAFGMAVRVLRDRSLAEDAVQETFVGVWRNAARFRPELATARTWILAIARNRSIDIVRKRRGIPIELTSDVAGGPDPWAEITQRLDRLVILELMGRLSDPQRRAIESAFLLGWTHAEIASATGAPVGTVKSRVRLGLLALRRMLEEMPPPFRVADCGGPPTTPGYTTAPSPTITKVPPA